MIRDTTPVRPTVPRAVDEFLTVSIATLPPGPSIFLKVPPAWLGQNPWMTMTDILACTLSPSPEAFENRVGDETVILHLGNGTYYGLDPVGTVMWGLLKQGLAPKEICRSIAESYGAPLEQVEADARRFLDDLKDHDIVAAN